MARLRIPVPWLVTLALLGGCGVLMVREMSRVVPGSAADQLYPPLSQDLKLLGLSRAEVGASVYRVSSSPDRASQSALYTLTGTDGRTLRASGVWRDEGKAQVPQRRFRLFRKPLGGRAENCSQHLGMRMLWRSPVQSQVWRRQLVTSGGAEDIQLVVWRRTPGHFSPLAARQICIESAHWRRVSGP